jgi:hypothetical protein
MAGLDQGQANLAVLTTGFESIWSEGLLWHNRRDLGDNGTGTVDTIGQAHAAIGTAG